MDPKRHASFTVLKPGLVIESEKLSRFIECSEKLSVCVCVNVIQEFILTLHCLKAKKRLGRLRLGFSRVVTMCACVWTCVVNC